MKLKSLLLVLTFTFLLLLAVPVEAQSKGSVSTTGPWLRSQAFNTSNVAIDGKINQAGYFSFNVTTPAGNMIWIWWRHNADFMDIIVKTNQTGFLAVAWRNNQPLTPAALDLFNTSRVIIGINGNSTARQDNGLPDGVHKADSHDYINGSTVFSDNNGLTMQFVYPLNATTSSTDNENLGTGYYGFFAFATGSEKSFDVKFADSNSMYVPWVYIGTWMDLSYWPPPSNSTPFGSPFLIVLAIFILPIIKKRRNN